MTRGGFTLVELVVALALGGIVTASLLGVLSGTRRLAQVHAIRVEWAEALRTAESVLVGELRFLDPRADIYEVGADSLALRAFRGSGVVCRVVNGSILVRYQGVRAPEPAKDSLLVVDAPGRERALPLEASDRMEGGCALRDGESLYRLHAGEIVAVGALVLVFESASYHLAASALRYRRGLSGRQPLTAEIVDDGASTFTLYPDEPAFEATLVLEPMGGSGSGNTARIRVGLLNGTPAEEGGP